MPDISDVEQTLADTVTSVVYPNGASNPSIASVTCRIYRGWPNAATLNADLAAGRVNITVAADNDSARTTTRYLLEWDTVITPTGLVASVSGQTISIGGTTSVGDVLGALIDGVTYPYRVQAGDTAAQAAANLCSGIQANRIATLTGLTINVPGARSISVRVVRDATASCEARRQEKDVRVIFWCPTPVIRDFIATAIDQSVAQTAFLSLPGGDRARIIYRNTKAFDQSQNALLYRRDLVYCVEYPTVITVDLPTLLFGAAAINGQITYG